MEAQCVSATQVEIVSQTPAKSYKVEDVSAAAVVFKHGNSRVRMAVTCSGGEPSVATSPQ